ncbi:hypothetical protein HDV57DRAFT_503513 [Trichoderma longibrachiatum]
MRQVSDALRKIAAECDREDCYRFKGSPQQSFSEKIMDLFSLARGYVFAAGA